MVRPREVEFSTAIKRAAWDRCEGRCEGRVSLDGGALTRCRAPLLDRPKAYDHILPAGLGGKPVLANCQVLCVECHAPKTKADTAMMRKADRVKNKAIGADKPNKVKMQSPGKKPRSTEKLDQISMLGPPGLGRLFR